VNPSRVGRLLEEGAEANGKRGAMAEVSLWAAAGGVALFSFGMAKKLGLLDPVPRDPVARVAHYSSNVLSVVKDQLIGAELESWEAHRVAYSREGKRGSIWVENGVVHCRLGDGLEVFPIGDQGSLTFAWEGGQMSIEIHTAESDGAERTSTVSVRMLQKSA
jgi:hypothetical protein